MPKKRENPNVLLVVIDAVRTDNVDMYGVNDGTTPHINTLAHEGLIFEDVYSAWNTTDQSLTSILTGKYPLSHGITNHGDKVTPEEITTFNKTGTRTAAEILREQGYETIAVDWMGRWFKRGFDKYGINVTKNFFEKCMLYIKYILNHADIVRQYMGKRSLKIPSKEDVQGVLRTFLFSKELAEIQDAAIITDTAIESIKSMQKDNFFLFLHYWDTHTPYHCPREYQAYRGSDKKERLISKYKGAIHYVDHHLGRLFDVLKAQGLWDNTLIIITSDHGESLTEHDIFFDHHGLYDATIHVPLMVWYPKVFKKPKRVKGFIQHIDLLPTILDIAKIDREKLSFDGQNLMPLIENEVAEIRPFIYSEESYVQKKRALRTKQYKYISATDGRGYCSYCHKIHGGTEELYDVGIDPREEVNIIRDKPQVHKELKGKLDEFVNQLIKKRQSIIEQHHSEYPRESRSEDDKQEEEKIKRRLQGLGYIE